MSVSFADQVDRQLVLSRLGYADLVRRLADAPTLVWRLLDLPEVPDAEPIPIERGRAFVAYAAWRRQPARP
jgi:hypothetical protein